MLLSLDQIKSFSLGSVGAGIALQAQEAVYGSHWLDATFQYLRKLSVPPWKYGR